MTILPVSDSECDEEVFGKYMAARLHEYNDLNVESLNETIERKMQMLEI